MENRKISHIEISAVDREKQSTFYASIFGWDIENMDHIGADYTVWQSGNMRGGFAPVGDDNKRGDVTVYLHSDDIRPLAK
jgi:predicted enzyme related to lactoylglutathione lyase